jgi:hypothetical protein
VKVKIVTEHWLLCCLSGQPLDAYKLASILEEVELVGLARIGLRVPTVAELETWMRASAPRH